MMREKADVQTDLRLGLESTVDPRLSNFGFSRKPREISYTRIIGEVSQVVICSVDFFPKYQKDAEIAFNPVVHLEMPSVTTATLELVRGDATLLAGAPEIVISQPANFCAPKSERVRWFASGQEELTQRAEEVGVFLAKWVVPALSELQTSGDLISAYERSDDRFFFQRHTYLFVVGAAMSVGEYSKAKSILAKELGAPGLRKRYRVAFEALGLEV